MTPRRLLLAVAFGFLAMPASPAFAAPPRVSLPGTLNLQTVPAIAGVVVQVDGITALSDANGRVAVRVRNFVGLEQRLVVPAIQVAADRKVTLDRVRGELSGGVTGKVIELGLRTSRLVSWRFLDRFGGDVPISRVRSMRLRSNTGEVVDVDGAALSQPHWVAESRTQQGPGGLVSKQLYYVVDSAVVNGASVVNRAQQRFVPWEQQQWQVQLLLYRVTFTANDLLFTDRVGHGVELTRPDGSTERLRFGKDGTVAVPDLPRGTYTLKVSGGGVSFARPVSISKDQDVALQVVSYLDLVLIGFAVAVAAFGLVLLGRPHLMPRLRVPRLGIPRPRIGGRPSVPRRGGRPSVPRPRIGGRRGLKRATAALFVLVLLAGALAYSRPAHAHRQREAVPVLAYYYIWFNPTSWNRAKIDYPLLGRYSSDDEEIMRRHVRMAKTAGVDGFLVSWKHTPLLDERLAKLVAVARAEMFQLGIVYQGLDFARQPLPLETVASDLALFAGQYGADPVFGVFEKPLVIWTGSDRIAPADIERTLRDVRAKLLVLGDAKSVEDCQTSGPVLDGQAYYWSSADPARGTTNTKLAAMSRAVHGAGGLWIAPAAPGFDARLVGGTKEVPRRAGETLRQSYANALSSSPDAIGVISWNEFSENTHIEPSERYGATDINVLSGLLGAGTGIDVPADSSDLEARHPGLTPWGALVLIVAALSLLPLGVALRRRYRQREVAR
jgi:hypothetical protein